MAWLIFKIFVVVMFTLFFNHEQYNKKKKLEHPQYWFNFNDSTQWQISKKRITM